VKAVNIIEDKSQGYDNYEIGEHNLIVGDRSFYGSWMQRDYLSGIINEN